MLAPGESPGVTVAQAVGETLAELDVRHVFGLVGSGNFAITNALVGAGAVFIPGQRTRGESGPTRWRRKDTAGDPVRNRNSAQLPDGP